MSRPQFEHITTDEHLTSFCEAIADAKAIAFDTEFVSEDTYRPQLCLIQVAADGQLAIIDPLAVGNIDPFWQLLAAPGHSTIVHAGREEFRFCSLAIDKRPSGWFDTQLAAAFIGLEYPAAYSTLMLRLLDVSVPKGETRTDWRKRPLSDRQLQYALHDVIYLEDAATILQQRIAELGRQQWLEEDIATWQEQLEAYDQQERWARVSGISGLSRRSLAIARELWRWRDAEAQRRDRPPKQLLRDDLIVELAKRKTSDPKRIRALRGMERGSYKRHIPEFSNCIARGLAIPDDECPRLPRRTSNAPQYTLLGQFVNSVLGCICRTAQLAPTLVGTVQDVRDLIAYQLDSTDNPSGPPALARGWRAEVVGRAISEVLQGKRAVRVADPHADQPLDIVELPIAGRED